MEVKKLIGERFEPKKIFFFKKNTLCHSFHIIVIPSIVLSFLPDYCHSFRIIVIPSVLVSFLSNYWHFTYLSSWIAPVPSHTWRVRKLAGRASHICEYFLNCKSAKFLIYWRLKIYKIFCENLMRHFEGFDSIVNYWCWTKTTIQWGFGKCVGKFGYK